jgi:hypothetical protein
MRDDSTLQEDFELGGRFWLPQAPEEKVGGTLRYAGGRVALSLLGVFGSAPAGADIDDAEFILGSTERGPCTLWRSIRGPSQNVASRHERSATRANDATAAADNNLTAYKRCRRPDKNRRNARIAANRQPAAVGRFC